MMPLETMTDEELGKRRTQIALEITDLNNQITYAKLSPQKQQRRALERERDLKYQSMRAIDAENKRRGREPQNA